MRRSVCDLIAEMDDHQLAHFLISLSSPVLSNGHFLRAGCTAVGSRRPAHRGRVGCDPDLRGGRLLRSCLMLAEEDPGQTPCRARDRGCMRSAAAGESAALGAAPARPPCACAVGSRVFLLIGNAGCVSGIAGTVAAHMGRCCGLGARSGPLLCLLQRCEAPQKVFFLSPASGCHTAW